MFDQQNPFFIYMYKQLIFFCFLNLRSKFVFLEPMSLSCEIIFQGEKNILPKMNFFRKQFDSIPRSFFFTQFRIQVRNKLIYCFFEILMKTFRKKWSRKLERRISLTATFLLFHEQPGFERRTFFRPGLPLTTDRLKSFFFVVDFCSVRLNFL